MTYFLDTNILIYLFKHRPPVVAQRVNSLPESDALCMSFVTYAELLQGAKRSARKEANRSRLEEFTQQVEVRYPQSSAICERYAEVAPRLKEAGTPIGANDLWIACHALAEEAVLVTHNTREFRRIPELGVEDWVMGT